MARKAVTADTDTDQLQDVVRQRLADNMRAPGHPEGDAVAEAARVVAQAVVAESGLGAALLEDPADPGTYIVPPTSTLTEDPDDPGTFLL